MRIRQRHDGLVVALLVLAPALLAASRDLDWFDGPELALAAVQGGVGHAPGQPLHAMLGALFSHLLPRYFGVTLVSVVPLCLLAVPATYLVDQLSPPQTPRARLLRAAAIAATLLCPPLFQTGTRVEVYCLSALCSLTALALATAARPLAAGILLGLCACANPAFAVFAGAAVFVMSCRSLPALARVFVGGLLGLVPYAYLPWAGRHLSRYIFGEPTHWAGFRDIVLLRAYQHNITLSLAHTLVNFITLKWMVLPALLVLLAGGIGLYVSRRWSLSLALMAMGLLHVFSLLMNKALPHNPDLHGYLIPTVLAGGIGVAALLCHLGTQGRGWLAPIALVLPLTSLLSVGPWISARAHGIRTPRILADAFLNEAPPRATVLLVTDHLYFPMMYRQEAEHARPDIVILSLGLARNEWFWARQRVLHPDLPAGLTPAEQLRRLLAPSSDRPLVAQAAVLLLPLQRPMCEGAFLISLVPPDGRCPPPDMARRLSVLTAMATDVKGDWIGERTVATQAILLAIESWTQGHLERALMTLVASAPQLAALGTPMPTQTPDRQRMRTALRQRMPEDALISPQWVGYFVGRALVALGDPRGEPLLAQALSYKEIATTAEP